IGPVTLILRALCDPLANGLLLGLAQFLVRELRRHNPGVLGEDALDNGAALRIAGNDGDYTRLSSFERLVANIEPQVRHAGVLVGTVASETGIRHDRTDVAVEADSAGGASSRDERREYYRTQSVHITNYRPCVVFKSVCSSCFTRANVIWEAGSWIRVFISNGSLRRS